MEQHLFTLLFFTGVLPLILSVPRKYYLVQQSMNWNNAQAYCKANHADLAIIESADNMVHIQYEIQRQKFTSSAWIGMYNDVNSWHWSMGNVPLGSYTAWISPEPNNWHGEEQCGSIDNQLQWTDLGCYHLRPFVCFDATKTGSQQFVYISTTNSWLDAQAYCRTYYTDLASIKTATENSNVLALVSDQTWFGLIRDGWKWVNKNNFSTISWTPGKPDNAMWNENCGYLYNGMAVDAQCSDIMPFFCYSLITEKQQIIKVKVQSIQDVNNPSTKVTILEQIKQELKDHGIAQNITFNWRVQPDGYVFNKEKGN
ncbi:putative C-type lectin domain family 20 member A [Clarias gariepinus]|uniref:putative C-type lectin domain family 20 member A n=1 Tax=Clarias gariepinus TaxID=13013 RepID=UPI00234DD69B|nr:putative C-type lectin domain family 20 member A [Clarias gariepinus]